MQSQQNTCTKIQKNMTKNYRESTKLIHTHDFRKYPKNNYTKKTTKLLPFSILQRNLSKFITQTCLYCSKQLETTFHQFCEKPLQITFEVKLS